MDNFIIVKGYESNSASPTDILECNLQGQDVIAKVYINETTYSIDNGQTWIAGNPSSADSLNYEAEVYGRIKNELIIPFNIRNILPLKNHYEFTFDEYNQLLIRSLNLSTNAQKIQAYNSIYKNSIFMFQDRVTFGPNRMSLTNIKVLPDKEYYSNIARLNGGLQVKMRHNIYRAIITSKLEPKPLISYIKENISTFYGEKGKRNFMNIMFIILITLYCMSAKGVNQNDLHWGNILFDTNFFGRTRFHLRKYIIVHNTSLFLIDLPGTPVIYDFDRASIAGKYNSDLDDYKDGGNCPEFHKKRDIMRTICCMYKRIETLFKGKTEYDRIKHEILQTIVKSENIRKSFRDMDDISCWMPTEGRTSLQCLESELDSGLADINDIIKWSIKHTGFQIINFEEYNSFYNKREKSCHSQRVQKFLVDFFSDFPKTEIEEHIKYNVQVVKLHKGKEALYDLPRMDFRKKLFKSLLKMYEYLSEKGAI